MESPRRALVLTLTIGADSKEDLAGALHCFLTSYERKELSGNGISGSPSFGWNYKIDHNPEMTHDRYFADLELYISEQGKEA